VKTILDSKGQSPVKYLVYWVGGGLANQTWELLHHVLPVAADAVRDFHACYPTKPCPRNLANLLGQSLFMDKAYAIRFLSPTPQTHDSGANEKLCHKFKLLT
jgi:hypothetical protein